MAARGDIPNFDGAFNSLSVKQSLYVRNKITANRICARFLAANELTVVQQAVVEALKVSGDATFCGNVNVSGDTEVNNIIISGNATINGDLFVSGNTTLNGDLFVSGDTTLQDLTVEGDTTLEQDLFVSGNTTLNGDLLVCGDTTLKSNLLVSGNTTLQDLLVEGDTTLNQDLFVSGNTTLQSDLLVCGDTTLKSNLFVSGGVTIGGNLKVSGNTSLCGQLIVAGDTTLAGDLFVDGTVTLNSDLKVSGNTTLCTDLLVKGNTTLAKLFVSGNTTLNGDLLVEGTVTLNDDLFVSGNTTLNQDLIVCGDTTLKADFLVQGDSTLEGNLFVSSNATINGNLKVNGSTSLCNDLKVGGNTTLDGTLKVVGNTSLCSDAQVAQDLQVDGDVNVSGNTTLECNLYVGKQVTLNAALKVSGSATFCGDVLITGATLATDDICIDTGHTLFTNSIAPKTGTQVTVGGPGDSVMVDRVVTRFIDGKFGGSVTIATGVNVLGDLSATGIICSTLPSSIVESNTVRSKDNSTTLVLGTAGSPKIVCIASGNTLQVDSIEAKAGGGGLLICATTLQAEVLVPKAGTNITIGSGGDTVNIADDICVEGEVQTDQVSPKTGSGLSLGTGGDLIQVRDNACIDGYLQTQFIRAKENNNKIFFERINGDNRVCFDISNPEFKVASTLGISLCPGNGFVQVDGTILANSISIAGGGSLTICASKINTDILGTKNSETLTVQNAAGTRNLFVNFFSATGPLLNADFGSLRLDASGGTGEVHVEGPMQTRRMEPDTNNTRDIGTAALRYREVFAKTVNTDEVTGPATSGLTINADDGAMRLTRSGAGDIDVTTSGVSNLVLTPGGVSVVVDADLCVTGTLAVDNIISKTGGGGSISLCLDTIALNTIQSKAGDIINIRDSGANNTVRLNLGAADGPLISAQNGQPLRLSGGPAGGLTLEQPATTRDLSPDTTGTRDIGTSALRYNDVFANIGNFDTRVDTPLVRNLGGSLELLGGNGVIELDRTGAGDITLDLGSHRLVVDAGTNGITLIGGTVEVNSDLCVNGTLSVDTINSKTGTTINFDTMACFVTLSVDEIRPKTGLLDTICVSATLQVDKIENKSTGGLTLSNTNAGSTALTTIQTGSNANMVLGPTSNALNRTTGNTGCGLFMGMTNSITGASTDSGIILGRNNLLNGANASIVLGGTSNSISANRSAILAGSGNTLDGTRNCILGGQDSAVSGNRSIVIGGRRHTIGTGGGASSVTASFIGGGQDCTIGSDVQFCGMLASQSSIIGPGAGGARSTGCIIGAGEFNRITRGRNSGIFAGESHTIGDVGATSLRSAIISGQTNEIDANTSAIIAGRFNRIVRPGVRSVIAGGERNCINANEGGGIFGGENNTISDGPFAVIIGGRRNGVNSSSSNIGAAIVGGEDNFIAAQGAGTNVGNAIMGAVRSSITSESGNTVICGGQDHRIFSTAGQNVIVGGEAGIIADSGNESGIFAGCDNTIRGSTSQAGILAGEGNSITGSNRAVILGGADNFIDGAASGKILADSSTVCADFGVVIGRFGEVEHQTSIVINAHDMIAQKLTSTDVERIHMDADNDIHVFCDIDMNGNCVINTSDQKKKEDIEDLGMGLTEVLQLRPRQFYFKDKNYSALGEPKRMGFIAQELETVNTGLVMRESNRKRRVAYRNRVASLQDKTPLPEELYNQDTPDVQEGYAVDYDMFIPMLTQAIKEQNAAIVDLQARVSTLEGLH